MTLQRHGLASKPQVVFSQLEKAVTGAVVRAEFERAGVVAVTANNLLDRELLGLPKEKRAGVPHEWRRDDVRATIATLVEQGLEKVSQADALVLTGGRDSEPELLGRDRHPLTDSYDVRDARDVVETYMLLRAVLDGKTVHATCRGMQLLSTNMLSIFADAKEELVLHLPEFYEQNFGVAVHHHKSHALEQNFDQVIRSHEGLQLIMTSPCGRPTRFFDRADVSYDVQTVGDSLFKEALKHSPIGRHSLLDRSVVAKIAASRHQGFSPKNADEMQDFANKLALAGGRATAISAHPQDIALGVYAIEGVEYSKVIDEYAVTKIAERWDELNSILGLEILMPQQVQKTSGVVRFDAHSTQCHPEMNVAAIGQKVVEEFVDFVQSKAVAEMKGQDLGGYLQHNAQARTR